MEKHERLLPGDFQRKLKYEALDNTEKEIQEQEGFFTFPESLKGDQDKGQRDFLVFYFDDKKQYEIVREFFDKKSPHCRSHPDFDSIKLYRLVRKANIIKNKDGN